MMTIEQSKFRPTLIEWSCQLVVACLYVLFGCITHKYLISQGIVSAVWLGSGVALSALLIGGWRFLWGTFFGMLIFNAIAQNSFTGIVGITLANVLEVIVGFWLLSKDGVVSQSVLHNYLRIILLGGGVASIVGGVIGASTLLLMGFITSADYLKNVLTWWMGDTLGVVLLVPLALIWGEKKLTGIRRKQWLEGALLVGASCLLGQMIFLNLFREFFTHPPKGYLMFFCVTVVAKRVGMRGVTLVIVITAIQALLGAYLKTGYFANDIAAAELSNYWLYILVLSVVGVSMASYVDKVNQTMTQLQLEIKERKHIEHNLKHSEQQLVMINKDLLQFTNIAAHHLQEPTRRMVSFVQRLQYELKEVATANEEVATSINFIKQSALRQRALVRDIQLYLAAIAPRATVGFVDVAGILHAVMENQKCLINETKARIEYGNLPTLWIDRPRLYDIFNVLIENALHYRKHDTIPKIHIYGEQKDGGVHYYVEDNGIGIPTEYRERVFLVFERLQISENPESTGIGLAIVQRILENCHGTVNLLETVGGGTTVVLNFPEITDCNKNDNER